MGTKNRTHRAERGLMKAQACAEPLEDRTMMSADTFASAIAVPDISARRTRPGVVCRNERSDFYRFRLAEDARVQIGLRGLRANATLRLHDGARRVVAQSARPGRRNEVIARRLTAGTYYVRVIRHARATRYRLDLVGAMGDGDDQLSEAQSLGAVSTSSPTIRDDLVNWSTDVDMYSVDVQAGQRLTFDTNVGAGADTYLRLFDAQGNEIASNDDGRAPGESASFGSYLEHTFRRAGRYYVGISGYENHDYDARTGRGDAPGTRGNYRLVVRNTTPLVTDSDPNDQLREATSLGTIDSSTTVSATLSEPSDVDMFSIDVQPGERFSFDTDLPGGGDTYMRLFDASGHELAYNDDGEAPGEDPALGSYLAHTFAQAGRYYVGISSYGNDAYDPITGGGDGIGSVGAYRMVVTNLGQAGGDGASVRRALLISAGFDNDCTGIRSTLLNSSGGEWSSSNITTLTSATVSQVRSALLNLAHQSDANDLALVYFTCHGGPCNGDLGTQDEPDGRDGILAMTDGHIRDDTLGGWCRPLNGVGQFVLIVDACHSEEMLDGGLDPAAQVGNSVCMSACQTTETALAGSPYSAFTGHLIEGLTSSSADLNLDGRISAEEAFVYADPLTCQMGHAPAAVDHYTGMIDLVTL